MYDIGPDKPDIFTEKKFVSVVNTLFDEYYGRIIMFFLLNVMMIMFYLYEGYYLVKPVHVDPRRLKLCSVTIIAINVIMFIRE